MRSRCGAPRQGLCPPYYGAPAPSPEPAREVPPPRFLHALVERFPPRRRVAGSGLATPYWRPELPECSLRARVVSSFAWARPYEGPVAVLDRNGAWPSAAASVAVAHGALERTGSEVEPGARPGYYLVEVAEWGEGDRLPSPLGPHGAAVGARVWVPAPTARLLADLAAVGRWPEVTVHDSWTGEPVKLTRWAGHVRDARAAALGAPGGRRSPEYAAVKTGFGQCLAMMLGQLAPGGGHRVWPRSPVHRSDWVHAIQTLAAATLWRAADDALAVCPELGPVAVRLTDELVVPADAVPVLVSTPRPTRPGGRARGPLLLDKTGAKLGTYKIKAG